jgi:hypothetical protein
MDISKDQQSGPPGTGDTGLPDKNGNEKPFFPGGAIAFFILLVLLSLLFWYGIYYLMIERT